MTVVSEGFFITWIQTWLKFCKCQNSDPLLCEINFLELPKIFLKFSDVKQNWKIQKLKNILFWKIFEKLARRWHIGTYIDTLARKNEKFARFWHIGTVASGHLDHAGTHGTHGTRFSKL